ncbi:hypothetical protein A5660_21370 [Mycobacterium alsense]|uniref:DUF2029 domain-containing protein n=1 Tax=Mycobacterium alsense TaxID=324058 RepID=UPI000801B4BD|nr:DUF2029 domain-containing protein [Mycobacterium alsense]OBJ02817.1 hypothetical protein A5660_21370 [Mycobacterium alsense]
MPLHVFSAVRDRLSVLTGQSERTILLGTILLASAISAATGFVLVQYYSVDLITSLIVFLPEDCYMDWPTKVGRHCFSDYSIPMSFGMAPDPWAPYPLYLPPEFKPTSSNYLPAGMVPQATFGLLGKWLGAPRLGLFGYLLALTIAVFSPAMWAGRGARGLERIVVFLACGVAAIPAWVVIDRGNVVGFVAPIALAYLVALCRRRWGLVAVMAILGALVKPQFAVLAVALFAARRWRLGGFAVGGIAVSNIAAYLLWPRDFPDTISRSLHNTLSYGKGAFQAVVANSNISFGKAFLTIPDGIKALETGGKIPDDFLAGPRSLIGYGVLLLVVVSVLALGKRLPPAMAGILLLATASLFPTLSNPYYLIFVLPIAALVVRHPDGPPGTGMFDRQVTVGGRRRAVGICVSVAAALCIAQIAIPGPPHQIAVVVRQMAAPTTAVLVSSTLFLAPFLWLVACGVTLVSYARRPDPLYRGDEGPAPGVPGDDPAGQSGSSEVITAFSPQRPTQSGKLSPTGDLGSRAGTSSSRAETMQGNESSDRALDQ